MHIIVLSEVMVLKGNIVKWKESSKNELYCKTEQYFVPLFHRNV